MHRHEFETSEPDRSALHFHVRRQLSLLDRGPIEPDLEFADIRRIELSEGAWIELAPGWVRSHDTLFVRGASMPLLLGEGDLLVMSGSSQRTWRHGIPKVAAAGPRISIMFRPHWRE